MMNQRGNTMVMVIVMTSVVSLLGLGMIQSQKVLHERVNGIRAKSKMLLFESRLKNLLLQTTTYQGCSYQSSGNLTCSLRADVVNPYLSLPIHGYPCKAASCRIVSSYPNLQLGASGPTVSFTIELQGEGLVGRYANIVVNNFSIPNDILQDRQINCPISAGAASPVFKGFTAAGNANCQPLARSTCGVGYFVSGLEPNTGSVVCSRFPTNVVSCGSGSGLSLIDWQGGSVFQGSCYSLPSPFAVMGPN